jgi:hypothetical protein
MRNKTVSWGEAVRDLAVIGEKALRALRGQAHLRRQVIRNTILLEPVRTSTQPVPIGWLIVELTDPSIFHDEWGAAQAISKTVRRCSSLGRLSEDRSEPGFVIIPKEDAQSMWSVPLLR